MSHLLAAQTIRCGCKVNLYLRILGRRADGYHNIESLFLPLDYPSDEMIIYPGDYRGIEFSCSLPRLEEGNSVFRAYKEYSRHTGFNPPLKVYLKKNIPDGAGLGGGSSNAAGMLWFLNLKAGEWGLSWSRLVDLAGNLGADVPFFLVNEPARVTGIGEVIQPVRMHCGHFWAVLVCPEYQVSTAWAYRSWDENPSDTGPGMQTLTNWEWKDNKSTSIRNIALYNSFEHVVFPGFPQLARLKMIAYSFMASGCVLSGSGSSLVAFFREERAQRGFCTYLHKRGVRFYKFHISRWGVAKR